MTLEVERCSTKESCAVFVERKLTNQMRLEMLVLIPDGYVKIAPEIFTRNMNIGVNSEVGMSMSNIEFMSHIIAEICNYAVANGMEADDTLAAVADNILSLLEISTFNNWKLKEE